MADKKAEVKEVDVIERARGFWARFSKPIIYISAAIILIGGGWLVYKYLFKLPKEQKANEVVFRTQKIFTDFSNAPTDTLKTSLAQKCLNGEGSAFGALKIMSRYGGTDAANLCAWLRFERQY